MTLELRLGLRAALALALLAFISGCAEKYDLRGPAPAKGDRIKTETKTAFSNGSITVTRPDGTVQGTYGNSSHFIDESVIDAVDSGRLTAFTQRIVKDYMLEQYLFDGKPSKDEQRGPLEGKTITHRWVNQRWEKSIKAGLLNRTSAEEQAALDALVPDLIFADFYPSEPVSVGHKWSVDSGQLGRLLGVTSASLQGEAKLHLKSVSKIANDLVATIDISMELRGKGANPGGGEYAGEFTGTGTFTRSLNSGSEKGSFTGHVVNERLDVDNGDQVHVRIAAPISITSESSVNQSIMPTRPLAKPVVDEGLLWRLFAPVLARNAPALGRVLWLAVVGALFGGFWLLWHLLFGRRRTTPSSTTAESSTPPVK